MRNANRLLLEFKNVKRRQHLAHLIIGASAERTSCDSPSVVIELKLLLDRFGHVLPQDLVSAFARMDEIPEHVFVRLAHNTVIRVRRRCPGPTTWASRVRGVLETELLRIGHQLVEKLTLVDSNNRHWKGSFKIVQRDCQEEIEG